MPLELPEEYLEHLDKELSTLEKLGDKFSGADERLDFVAKQLQGLVNIPSQLEAVLQALGAAGIEVKEVAQNIREIRIQQNVLLNTGMILTQPPPFDGYIREVKIHWPPGCNGLVDVRVGHGTKQFCPFEGFLSLDNVTPTYPFNEYVVHTENIFVEIQNTDGINAHTISVMLNILEKV